MEGGEGVQGGCVTDGVVGGASSGGDEGYGREGRRVCRSADPNTTAHSGSSIVADTWGCNRQAQLIFFYRGDDTCANSLVGVPCSGSFRRETQAEARREAGKENKSRRLIHHLS